MRQAREIGNPASCGGWRLCGGNTAHAFRGAPMRVPRAVLVRCASPLSPKRAGGRAGGDSQVAVARQLNAGGMRLFLDSADPKAWARFAPTGTLWGATTNPGEQSNPGGRDKQRSACSHARAPPQPRSHARAPPPSARTAPSAPLPPTPHPPPPPSPPAILERDGMPCSLEGARRLMKEARGITCMGAAGGAAPVLRRRAPPRTHDRRNARANAATWAAGTPQATNQAPHPRRAPPPSPLPLAAAAPSAGAGAWPGGASSAGVG